jgi:hypothetical protein
MLSTLLAISVYFLVIFLAALLLAAFFLVAVRYLSSPLTVWISICVVHLIAILAFEYYHPSVPGNLDEPRIAEQSQWLLIFPPLLYCFPSSVLSYALGAALSLSVCPIFGPQACDSELVSVGIWWLIPVVLGYLQWFKLFPWLLMKFEKRPSAPAVT